MKSAIIALCFVACAFAGSLDKDATVVIDVYDRSPDGQYQASYQTSNGIVGQASGVLKTVDKELALEVSGSNSYIGADGKEYRINFVANENGYQPQADFLPTPPAPQAIPDYIARSLEYIKAHPYVEKRQ